MPAAIRLSDELVEAADKEARRMHRSAPKQIEYWALLGKAAEEHPDVPLSKLRSTFDIVQTIAALENAQESDFSVEELAELQMIAEQLGEVIDRAQQSIHAALAAVDRVCPTSDARG